MSGVHQHLHWLVLGKLEKPAPLTKQAYRPIALREKHFSVESLF
jgi:hypothetical protein